MSAQVPYQPLLDLATPEIYRCNPFRVLGLSPRATGQEADRAAKRKRMESKLGMGTLTEAEIDDAMARLRNPTARLLDEFFWFWPTDTGTAEDPAIQAWTQDQAETARSHWQTQTQRADLAPLATHNLAILDHLSALDQEQSLSATAGFESRQGAAINALWQRGLSLWDQVVKDAEFWNHIEARIRDLNDAQLTTGLVRPLRETMPLALSAINARLAYTAAERGDCPGAQRQIRILGASPLDDEVCENALAEVLKPLRARVATAVDQAKARWAATAHQANRHIRDLHTQVQPLLAIADCLLEKNDFGRIGLHDLVAQTILDGETAFSNKTNDWSEGCALLALAESIAVGEPVREKLASNIKINKDNVETGNDWCSPGYWDLSAPTVEALEAARKKAMAGDFDGTITALVVMDATIGKPLRRCLAYALSIKAIRMVNQALDDYNAETGKIKKIMDRLRGMSESEWLRTLSNPPNPYSYSTPPCLTGCNRSYDSWVSFTYRDLPLFMCSACNEESKRERENKERQLRNEVGAALEYIVLASEIEQPVDRGVARNLKQMRKTAEDSFCPAPDTAGLRRRLMSPGDMLHGTSGEIETPAAGAVCHFCSQTPASESSGITVRLSGPIRETALLLGSRIGFSYIDVVVPRCSDCRNEHRQLPERLAQWNEARDATVADGRFPALLAELTAATPLVTACQEKTKVAHRSVERLKRGRGIAIAVYTFAMLGLLLVALQQQPVALDGTAILIEEVVGWNADESLRYLPLIIALLVGPVLGWGVAKKLHRGHAQRLQKARAELAIAIDAEKAAISTQEAVKSRLAAAKAEALAAYRQDHPIPELPAHMKPEATYVDYPGIATRQGEGWSIGMHIGTAKANERSRTSEHVSGLVAA